MEYSGTILSKLLRLVASKLYLRQSRKEKNFCTIHHCGVFLNVICIILILITYL